MLTKSICEKQDLIYSMKNIMKNKKNKTKDEEISDAMLKCKTIYMIAIGGIGMSGLAKMLKEYEYYVGGSDLSDSDIMDDLRSNDIDVFVGHDSKQIIGYENGICIISSAISESNEELIHSRKIKMPIFYRSEILAWIVNTYKNRIAISGSHGKTTVTSIVSWIMDVAEKKATTINGGVMNNYGDQIKINRESKNYIIVEADESDNSFNLLERDFAVITNISKEHLENYSDSFEVLISAFSDFFINTKKAVVVCSDDDVVRRILLKNINTYYSEHDVKRNKDEKEVYTYGFKDFSFEDDFCNLEMSDLSNSLLLLQNDLSQINHTHCLIENAQMTKDGIFFDLTIKKNKKITTKMEKIFFNMYGNHNILNGAAGCAVGMLHGISEDKIRLALRTFLGTKRRFSILNANKQIMDEAIECGLKEQSENCFLKKENTALLHNNVNQKNSVKSNTDLSHISQVLNKSIESLAVDFERFNGKITIVDDYAHHPNEIAATIDLTRILEPNRVISVVQPHRYTRLNRNFSDFVAALKRSDIVIIMPVYAAGESPMVLSSDDLYKNLYGIMPSGSVYYFNKPEKIIQKLIEICLPDDLVLFMGAGNITDLAKSFSEIKI